MRRNAYTGALVLLLGLFFSTAPVRAQQAGSTSGAIVGAITDAETGEPLPGANVILRAGDGMEVIVGAATNADGRYRLGGIAPGDYLLTVRYVGYSEREAIVSVGQGAELTYDFSLDPTGLNLNDVVVTASRQAEKVLDAPASISVLDARELERDITPSPVIALRNTPGVDMAQTGVDRYEVALRGFNNAFSGATYVLTDYRQGAVASLGVNAYNMMPLSQIDLERVEVVRGPGSALYGAGVDAGVVHFISKDPFTEPGTTVSLGGGERDLVMGALRHAGVVNDRFGYKVVGSFTRAEEWHFDADNPLDRVQLATFRPEALPVDYDNWKYNATLTAAYRFSPSVTLTANGGYASSKSVFLSGIGTLQSDGFGYSFGQLRLQAGDFFAQAYVNQNDTGDSFVYAEGAVEEVIDYSRLVNVQAQYDFGLMDDRLNVIVGSDYELTLPDTDGTINGRNEDEDDIAEVGAYAQATAVLSPKFDLTGALRGDYNNVVDEMQLSPRAALVFKPTPGHSLRATYNRAFSSPGTNSLFLDIVARRASVLTFRARGAAEGYTFRRDASGELIGSSLFVDFGSDRRVDALPFADVYGAIYGGLTDLLEPGAPLPAPLDRLSPQQLQGLFALLDPAVTQVQGSAPVRLGLLNLTTQTVDTYIDDVVDVAPLKQTVSQTFELGYKGVLGERVLVAVDGYYTKRKNFIGPLGIETPFAMAPAIRADLQQALAAGIANNPQLMGALRQLQQGGLIPPGVPVEAAASQLILDLAAGSSASLQGLLQGVSPVSSEGTPIAIVQPEESQGSGELLLTYRNYGDVDWYGIDASTQVLLTDRWNLFGNVSWVNDNFFTAEELGEEGTDLALSMNAPRVKLKGGVDYVVPNGLNLAASVRYTDGFTVRSGPYVGEIEAYTLVDLGAGYDFGAYVPGLRADLTVLNALDNVHREFIGAPQIGRMAMARLTYTL